MPSVARSTKALATPVSRSSRNASAAMVDLPAPTAPVITSTGTGLIGAASGVVMWSPPAGAEPGAGACKLGFDVEGKRTVDVDVV